MYRKHFNVWSRKCTFLLHCSLVYKLNEHKCTFHTDKINDVPRGPLYLKIQVYLLQHTFCTHFAVLYSVRMYLVHLSSDIKKMFERMRINYVHEFLGLLMHAFLSLFYAWLLRKSSKIIWKYEKVTYVVDQRKCIKKHSR